MSGVRPSSSNFYRPNPALKVKVIAERNEDTDIQTFANALREVLPAASASAYAQALVKHAINPDAPLDLTEDHLSELGVKIGHRDVFRAVISDLKRVSGPEALEDMENEVVKEPYESPLQIAPHGSGDEPTTFGKETIECAEGAQWTEFSGSHMSLDTFLNAMKDALNTRFMPVQFVRMFFNNKPLPFEMQAPLPGNRMATAMLFRVPSCDILPEDRVGPHGLTTQETTLHKVMNRLVMIYTPASSRHPAQLLTYRKDRDAATSELKAKLRKRMPDETYVEHVAMRIMRESMEVFRDVLDALQQELEVCSALPDTYRPKEVVKTLSRVQRQAAVMRRSLNGNGKVLAAIVESNVFGEEANSVLHVVQDLKEIADELESNSQQMLDLRMAMIDFKGQMNMRLFTNMTVVVAPLGIITGWFGMNFEDMKELSIEGFYYGVVVFVVLLVLGLSSMLWWLNRDRPVSKEDAAEAEVVLRKAEKEQD